MDCTHLTIIRYATRQSYNFWVFIVFFKWQITIRLNYTSAKYILLLEDKDKFLILRVVILNSLRLYKNLGR